MMKRLYLLLSVAGTIVPFAIFIPWLQEHGFNISLLVSEWFANRISRFFAADFLISWLVWAAFMVYDRKKVNVAMWWIPLIGHFCIGLSFSLPFYLFLREGAKR